MAEFPHSYNIHRIVLYGDLYAHRLTKNVNKILWADVARGAQVFLENLKPQNFSEFVNSPLWHNSHLLFQYRQDLSNKGYRLIKDILDTHGDLLSLDDIHKKCLKINHLDYKTLRFNFRNIKQTIKKSIEPYGPEIPNILLIIGVASKGCANTYKHFF